MLRRPPKSAKLAVKTSHLSLTPKFSWAEQFPNDFYASHDMLHCKFCPHNVNWEHIDMCKNHLWSEAHVKKKTTQKHGNHSAAQWVEFWNIFWSMLPERCSQNKQPWGQCLQHYNSFSKCFLLSIWPFTFFKWAWKLFCELDNFFFPWILFPSLFSDAVLQKLLENSEMETQPLPKGWGGRIIL